MMVAATAATMNSVWGRICLLLAVMIVLHGPSFSTRNRSSIYALAYGSPEVRTCKDRKRYSIRRKGKRYKICDWVAEKPSARCNRTIVKRRRANQESKRIKIDPKTYCGCTCLSSTDIACPSVIINPIHDFHQSSCGGHQKGTACDYEWIWVGCTYAELRCQPITRCTCGNPFSSTEAPAETPTRAPKPDDWICAMSIVEYCPPSREEPIPPQLHHPCTENETPPLPPIIL